MTTWSYIAYGIAGLAGLILLGLKFTPAPAPRAALVRTPERDRDEPTPGAPPQLLTLPDDSPTAILPAPVEHEGATVEWRPIQSLETASTDMDDLAFEREIDRRFHDLMVQNALQDRQWTQRFHIFEEDYTAESDRIITRGQKAIENGDTAIEIQVIRTTWATNEWMQVQR